MPKEGLAGTLAKFAVAPCAYTPIPTSDCKPKPFQTPVLAAFDIEVDANSCFPELLLAVATVDVACRYCTLAIGGGNGVVV
jgi:hypothetical protein